ncbi:single-stranded DNA-binding protein [Rosettibacter firmus]|uniref:single-stranded DNA-binding protein n=1 Tax=Rosettibacter firmus TaxID=3111522 RepID=UPI00336C1D5C
MAFSLNKVMLIGNLGADAETRFTTNNVAVTTFPLATSRSYKNQNNEWVNETTWHTIVCFNLSDFYKEALKKGKKFYIEGRISKREYQAKEDNSKRYVTEIIAEQIIPLDTKGNAENIIDNDVEKPVEKEIRNNDISGLEANSGSEEGDLPF